MKYIGVEGSSYVGKTTALAELAARGYPIIPEYDEFGPFPNSDGSVNGLKHVVDELLERDKIRSSMLNQEAINFSDRTPISLVTFEDMKMSCSPHEEARRVHEEVRDYSIAKIHELTDSGLIALPSAIAVLRLKHETEFAARVRIRGVTDVGELALFSTQLHIADQAIHYSRSIVAAGQFETIDVDWLTPNSIADRLVDFADKTI